MKTLTLLAALACAVPAAAAGRAGVLSLSGHGGAAQPLGTKWVKERAETGPSFGGAVHYGLSDHFEGTLAYDTLRMYETGRVKVDAVTANLVHYYDLGALSPAVRLGAGPAVVYGARRDGVPNHNTFVARLGLGADYRLTERLSTGFWADYFLAAKSVRKVYEVHAAVAGLSLRWTGGELQGRTAPAAAARPAPAPAKAAAPAPAPEPEAAPEPAPAPAPKTPAKPRPRTQRRPAAPPTETPSAVQEVPGE